MNTTLCHLSLILLLFELETLDVASFLLLFFHLVQRLAMEWASELNSFKKKVASVDIVY